MNSHRTACFENRGGFARYDKIGHAVGIGYDLYVLPRYFPSPSCFQSLQKSLFRRKAGGVRLIGRRSFCVAVRSLTRRKNTVAKPGRSGERLADAIDFNNVDADGKYHGTVVSRQ